MEKRIYSLNLIAYITYKTAIEPELKTENNTVYAVFPECKEVGTAIKEFNSNDCTVNLHKFLNQFKELKQKINQMR